ncbi:MAG: acyl-CoA thioesterase [Chloroflexota bacterium]
MNLEKTCQVCDHMDDLLKPYAVKLEIPVLWGHMDSMQHVNNTVYFRYMESARLDYFLRFDPEMKGAGMILHSTSCRFRIPLTYPDTVTVTAKITKLEEYRAYMHQTVVSHKYQKVAAEGSAILVGYDYEKLEKAPIPESVKQIMISLDNPEIG